MRGVRCAMVTALLCAAGCQFFPLPGDDEGQSSDVTGPSVGGRGVLGRGGAGGADSACRADPLDFCPRGLSGRWCVEQPFGDQDLVLQSVWSDRPDDAWVVGFAVGVPAQPDFVAARWDGCGWTSFANPQPGRFSAPQAVWGSSADDVWIAGSGGRALHFNGKTLTSVPIGDASTIILALSGSGPDDVWAAGAGLFHWDGKAWKRVSLPSKGSSDSFPDVWVAGRNDVWAIDLTDALRFDGATWTAWRLTQPQQGVRTLNAIFTTRNKSMAASMNDDAFWSIKGGIATEFVGSRTSGFADVGGAPDGADIHAASISTDGLLELQGETFVPVADAPAQVYGGVWVSPSQVWAAGAGGTVIRRARARSTPLPFPLRRPQPMPRVQPIPQPQQRWWHPL